MTTPETHFDALIRIVHELRTYNPAADEYKGEHIHKYWARAIEASARALAAIPAQGKAAGVVSYSNPDEERTDIEWFGERPATGAAIYLAPTPPTAPAQDAQGMTPLLSRAIELHEKAGMPWVDAEELALGEAGIDDAILDELIGEAGYSGLESILTTADELRRFTRSVLVHQPIAALRASSPADPREPLSEAQCVPMSEHELEFAARKDFNPGIDWSMPENLGISAVQRAYFRRGVRFAENAHGIVTKEST